VEDDPVRFAPDQFTASDLALLDAVERLQSYDDLDCGGLFDYDDD
jgi:hypothetical protein